MKKTGFTLAEVLISLSIVGVIAAITLPSLHLSVEKQKVGPALMKAVNTLEVANSVALQMEEAVSLSDIHGSENGYLAGILQNYTKLVAVDGGYSTKDGILIFADSDTTLNTAAATKNQRLNGKYYTVKVDTNGAERMPNTEGKDVFTLYVDTSGIVLPHGSKLAEGYITDMALWTAKCVSNKKGAAKTTPGDAKTCAGSIVDNGGRMLYHYEGITNTGTASASTSGTGNGNGDGDGEGS